MQLLSIQSSVMHILESVSTSKLLEDMKGIRATIVFPSPSHQCPSLVLVHYNTQFVLLKLMEDRQIILSLMKILAILNLFYFLGFNLI